MQHAGIKDILSGLIFVAFGVAFGYAASSYELGTAFRMGPGYFPLLLAGALVVLGVAIVIKGLTAAAADTPVGVLPWRGAFFILAALVFFGATIRGLGLVATLFGAALLAALASRSNPPVAAVVIAAALTAMCVLVFHYGLGVTVPLRGPWLGG